MSLKGVPVQVTKVDDFVRINNWIRTCCILHNVVRICGDEDEEHLVNREHRRESSNAMDTLGSGATFREILKRYVIMNE